MPSWEVKGPVRGLGKSWRDMFPELASRVERIRAPYGRNIAWEGTEVYAYKDRPKNLNEALKATVARFPGKEAFVFKDQRLTWSQFGEKVNNMALCLQEDFGINKGDRIGLLLPGSLEFVISYYATIKAGAIAVPHNLGLTAEGILEQIEKVGPKVIIISPAMLAKIQTLRERLNVKIVLAAVEKMENTVPVSALIEKKSAREATAGVDEWDVASIVFTSGTTGRPKGTMALHINILGCAQTVVDMVKLNEDDINIIMPPLYHATALHTDMAPSVLLGNKCVIMEAFDPREAIRLIEREKATWAVAAPIMLWFIMQSPEFAMHDLSSLKKIAFGGHASSETFIRTLMEKFSPVAAVNAGSVSEHTAAGFGLPTEDAIRKITCCGLATPSTEITLFDDEGGEIPEFNKIGEVAYKGQQTNAGYWEDPGATSQAFRKDGYVLSGDWARIDEEGYLWLLDRKKDMIVRGGQNVYCIEVENKIYLLDKVLSVGVVGVPDHIFAERIKAVIRLKPGETATIEEIREHCGKHLAPYEIPEYVVFVSNIPTNPSGKTLKSRLVDLWGGGGTEVDVFRSYCGSMHEKLTALPIIKLRDEFITPRDALKHLDEDTDTGREIKAIIGSEGVVGLLKPDEARFRK